MEIHIKSVTEFKDLLTSGFLLEARWFSKSLDEACFPTLFSPLLERCFPLCLFPSGKPKHKSILDLSTSCATMSCQHWIIQGTIQVLSQCVAAMYVEKHTKNTLLYLVLHYQTYLLPLCRLGRLIWMHALVFFFFFKNNLDFIPVTFGNGKIWLDEKSLLDVHTFSLEWSKSLMSRAFSSSSSSWYRLLTSAAPSITDSFFRVSSSSSCVFLKLVCSQRESRWVTVWGRRERLSLKSLTGSAGPQAHLEFILLFLQIADLGLHIPFLHYEVCACLVFFLL